VFLAARHAFRSIRDGHLILFVSQWMLGGVTVDFDGHYLLTRPLTAGETFTFSISGRSSKFAVADIYLLVCDPSKSACGGGWTYFNTAVKMGVSSCAA